MFQYIDICAIALDKRDYVVLNYVNPELNIRYDPSSELSREMVQMSGHNMWFQ